MVRLPPSGRRDEWGRRQRDPFNLWLRADPRRAAFLSALVTVSLVIFWISVVIGLIVYIIVWLS